ncbi:uncharacterized protein [Oscarella lobularis]|uniref:uncharacterized protein n=1 Tax=Oscarella lobularis TaxID=121494 RepID=UPI0033133A30
MGFFSSTKRFIAASLFSRLVLVVALAAIIVPILAYVVSQNRAVSATAAAQGDSTTSIPTCFPTVTRNVEPLVRSLVADNVSQDDLLTLLDIMTETNFSHPSASSEALLRVIALGIRVVRPIMTAFNVTHPIELLTRLPVITKLFRTKGPLVCHRDTVPDNDQGCCYFSCSNWDWYEAKEIKAAHGMLYTAFALGIIMIVIAIVVLVKVPSERTFPNVIPYYVMVIQFVISFVMCIIHWIGKETSFCCNKANFLEATFSSGACGGTYVQTITEQYGGISLAFWWASAAFNIWLFIVFPQNVSKTNMKLLFLFESVIAWILPAFFIGVQFSLKGKDTFTLQPFCHDCMGLDEQVLYFFYILQVQIVTGLAGFFISWFIYKKYRSVEEGDVDDEIAGKVIAENEEFSYVSNRYIYYVVAIFFSLTLNLLVYSIFTLSLGDIESAIEEYFLCAAFSFNAPDACVRGGAAQYSTVLILLLWPFNVLGLALINLSYLIFTIRSQY